METSVDISLQNLCIFCGKSAKKHQGQRQPLNVLDKKTLIKSLAEYKEFIEESEVYKKILSFENLSAHRLCRKEYFNKLRQYEKKPETNFHKNLELHKEAFDEICNFIDEYVIEKKSFLFFTTICNNYLDIITNIALKKGEKYDNVFSKSHFESKLKKSI